MAIEGRGRSLAAGVSRSAPSVDERLGSFGFPIAAVLTDRGIPFVFATGYCSAGVEAEYPGVPVDSKPFTSGKLDEALTKAKSAASRS